MPLLPKNSGLARYGHSGYVFDEGHDPRFYCVVTNGCERIHDLKAWVAFACALRRGVQTFEKERCRYIQDARQIIQATCGDAVGPDFVFLNLLKRQVKFARNVGLRQSANGSYLFEFLTDVNIYWV